jgi:hypothetical protein
MQIGRGGRNKGVMEMEEEGKGVKGEGQGFEKEGEGGEEKRRIRFVRTRNLKLWLRLCMNIR